MPSRSDRPIHLAGYPDTWVARPGNSVSFHINSDNAPFRARLTRLDGKAAGGQHRGDMVRDLGVHAGVQQHSRPGSYILVPDAADALRSHSFLVDVWIWPTLPGRGRPQVILSRADPDAEITLRLNDRGALEFLFSRPVGSQSLSCDRPLAPRRWYRVRASLDGDLHEAHLEYEVAGGLAGHEHASRRFGGPVARPGDRTPLLIGARQLRGRSGAFFEGKLEAPSVFRTAVAGQSRQGDLVAAWDFGSNPASTQIQDIGPNGLHGRSVNAPTRLVTGHTWDGTEVDPRQAPADYRAAHFHSDDLEDASWQPVLGVDLAPDLPSGVYAAELSSDADTRWIPFVVAPRRPSSHIAVLLPTFTYLAYANFRISDRAAELAAQLRGLDQPDLSPEERYVLAHPELGLSLYDTHLDGSPNCYSSRLRPVMEMSPLYKYSYSGAPRHFSTDLQLLAWMRRRGHAPDVFTDECLHNSGLPLLEPYRVVVTGSHPEYCTAAMREALRAYVSRGGRVMYLGGNGFYWVTSTSDVRPHLIEVRRGHAGTRTGDSPPGEEHHSLTGEIGGLWRHRGLPPQSLVGVGFGGLGYGSGAGYRQFPEARKSRFAYALDGVPVGDVIGAFGPTGGAADDEMDHVSLENDMPAETVVLATSKGNHRDGYHHCIEDIRQLAPDVMQPDNVGADLAMTDWAGGGITFAVGSIGWINCLSHDNDTNNVSTVTANVLRAFSRANAKPISESTEPTGNNQVSGRPDPRDGGPRCRSASGV